MFFTKILIKQAVIFTVWFLNISEGEVYAVTNIVSGSTYFVVVVNPGTPDGSTYFRFSCLVSMILNIKKCRNKQLYHWHCTKQWWHAKLFKIQWFCFTQAVSQSGSTVTVVEKSGSCGPGQNTTLAGTGGSKYTMTPYSEQKINPKHQYNFENMKNTVDWYIWYSKIL